MTTLHKTTRARTSLVVLYSQNYAAGIREHHHKSSDCFEYPKKSPLKSRHPKKYLLNFPTQKKPESEISNLKKSFDHPRHLKSGVPPLWAPTHPKPIRVPFPPGFHWQKSRRILMAFRTNMHYRYSFVVCVCTPALKSWLFCNVSLKEFILIIII